VAQERLCGLALLSTEKKVASSMNYSDLTARRSRKVDFVQAARS
jgi:hypothetical protein